MEKLLFTLLLLGSAAGVGLAGISGWMQFRMWLVRRQPICLAQVVTKAGLVVTNGTLTYRLAELGATEPSGAAWFYLAGLVAMTVGLAMQTKNIILEYAAFDVEEKNDART